MSEVTNLLKLLSVACLGIYSGAMLTEGFLNVPYWRSLPPAEFFSWYAANDQRLIGYFRPLTVLTAVVTILAALASHASGDPSRVGLTVSAVLMIVMIAMFLAIFRGLNESFAHASVAAADLPAALARWSSWHVLRVVLSFVALASSLLALRAD